MLNHLSVQSKPLFVSRIDVSQALVLPVHAQKQTSAKFLLWYKGEISTKRVKQKQCRGHVRRSKTELIAVISGLI